MPMRLTLQINDGEPETWDVRNVGHPVTGGHPDGDDLRRYTVTGPDGATTTLLHLRRSGRHMLAARVLLAAVGTTRGDIACASLLGSEEPAAKALRETAP